ncbi:hypothetical protein CCACVL1_24368 [Corchorus capsularis]|uniref:Uncharacterized protein n=1 Tax=Corchorus capsularis TaxID=210143 RepID=A0A1R3GPW5_COCAP|nr:hypothetical protein CCACVL1_24368 [Corchorus capsularis]
MATWKLVAKEFCKHSTKDFGSECHIGRFHNIYGPFGTWKVIRKCIMEESETSKELNPSSL